MDAFKHITVIDPGQKVAETDCFNNIAAMSPVPCTYHLPGMTGAGSLDAEDPDLIKAILVFGGSADIDEPLDWRLKLEGWLEKCLLKNVPVLGFCWGHQWIAKVFGGEVGLVPSFEEKVKGFRPISVDACGPFKASSGEVVVSHRSMVLSKPSQATEFVRSNVIENEGFIYKDHPIYTFQCHPEATKDFLRNNSFPSSMFDRDISYGNGLVKEFLSSC